MDAPAVKRLVAWALAGVAAAVALVAQGASAPLQPSAQTDVAAYMGTWYQAFGFRTGSRSSVSPTRRPPTATVGDGTVEVINRFGRQMAASDSVRGAH